MTSTRPNQRSWVTAYENPPPAACATLRALANIVEFGLTCVFAEEDGDPLPNSINTACLPWATGTVPATSIFYSPATACPTSWTAVATRTAAESATDWIDGETALECCPAGFTGGVGGMCNPGPSGTTPVVGCGEADTDENENIIYTAGSWPASVSARVTALQLRYQPTDVGGSEISSTGTSSSTSTNTSSSGSGSGNDGLSVGAKAAIGTVVPLVVILAALVAFMLWRRRKHSMKAAALSSKHNTDDYETKDSYLGISQEPLTKSKDLPITAMASRTAAADPIAPQHGHHETPEWNTELDATEAERRNYMAVQGSLFPAGRGTEVVASSPGGLSEASELGGVMRAKRKPVAPVELDSTPVLPELSGDTNTERR